MFRRSKPRNSGVVSKDSQSGASIDSSGTKKRSFFGSTGLSRNSNTYSSRRGLIFAFLFAVIGTIFVVTNFAATPYGEVMNGADELVAKYEVPMSHNLFQNDFPLGSPPAMMLYGNGLMLCVDHMAAHTDNSVSPLMYIKRRNLNDAEKQAYFDKIRELGFDNLLSRILPDKLAPPAGSTSSISLVTTAGERRVTLFNGETSPEFDAIASYINQECMQAKDDYSPDDVQLDTIALPDTADSTIAAVPVIPLGDTSKNNGFNSTRLTGDDAKKAKALIGKGNRLYRGTDGKKLRVRVVPNLPELKAPSVLIKNKSGGGLVHADSTHKVRFLYVVAADQATPANAQTSLNDLAATLPGYYYSQLGKTFITEGVSVVKGAKTAAQYKTCPSGYDCSSQYPNWAESIASHYQLQNEFKLTGFNTITMYSWGASNICIGWGGPTLTTDNVSVTDYGFDSFSGTQCWPEALHLLGAHEGGHGFGLVHTCDGTIMDGCGKNTLQGYGAPMNANQAALLRNYSAYFNNPVVSNPLLSGSTFISVSPARILETRAGYSTVDGQLNSIGRLAAGSTTQVQVAGRAGIPSDALAGALNVTVINPSADGYVTVYPCGTAMPGTSNINYTAGNTVSNAVISKLGSGKVCVYANNATDMVIDVNGAFPAGSGSSYTNIAPARIMETRAGYTTADGQFNGIGRLRAGSITQLQVNGRVGIPADASSVSMNVTTINPGANGYMVVFPCDISVPGTSTINYTVGSNISNAVISKIGNGKVCIYVNNDVDMVVDINGAFNTVTAFSSVAPSRLLETRYGYSTVDGQYNGIGRVAAGSVTSLQVGGRATVSGDALATVMNITVINPSADGYLTVYPCGTAVPGASTVNYRAGVTISNLAISQLGSGKVCIYANNQTDLVVDVNGVFGVSDTQQYVASSTVVNPVPVVSSTDFPTPTPSQDTTAPSAPTGLKITSASSSQLTMSWTASTDNVGVVGYMVLRNGSIVNKYTTALNYTDSYLTPSTSYSYQVQAFDAAGNISAASQSLSGQTTAVSSRCQGVTIYKDANMTGSYQSLATGSYDSGNLSIGNDSISSIKVPTGCKVTLYQNSGYAGANQQLLKDWTGSASDPWNDIASSVIVAETDIITAATPISCVTNGVKIYKDANFGGSSQSYSNGKFDTKSIKMGDNRISSVKVTPGCRVVLYQDKSFLGATKVLTSDWAGGTADPWNDLTSSLEVTARATIVTGSEMLVNSGFESGLTNWSFTQPNGGRTTFDLKSGGAQSGTYYSEANSNPYGGGVYQSVAATPQVGDTYRLTAWVKSPSCTASNGNLTLWSLWNQENGYTGFTADCTWRQITAYFTARNAGNTELRPFIALNSSNVSLDIDSVSLVKITYVQ